MIDLFGHKKEMEEILATGLRGVTEQGVKIGYVRGLIAVGDFLKGLRRDDMTPEELDMMIRIFEFVREELEAA